MRSPRPPHLLLVCLSAGLFLLAFPSFSCGGPGDEVQLPSARPAGPIDPQPLRPTVSRYTDRASLRAATRRFLTAFLRYEVGDLSSSVRRDLRATASSSFLGELLARPPRRISGLPPTARIVRLRTIHLSRVPPRALLSGSARRDARLEQFSFLFEVDRGAWRAVGPGE